MSPSDGIVVAVVAWRSAPPSRNPREGTAVVLHAERLSLRFLRKSARHDPHASARVRPV